MELNQYGRPSSMEEYDLFLENGWFRSGLYVFTCHFIEFDRVFYRTIWLRHDLFLFTPGKTWRNLQKRNRALRIEFSEATNTPEQEYLFRRYREALSFEPARNIHHLLYDNRSAGLSPFNTYQVCVYDDEQLIACSYFDIGLDAVAGIAAFYNPVYASSSMGIYLIYLQMIYCQQAGLRYYYPGYFIPHYSHFDYKLGIGKSSLTFLDYEQKAWLSFSQFTDKGLPYPFF